MKHSIEKYLERKEEVNSFFNSPSNRFWKITTIVTAILMVAIQIAIFFLVVNDALPEKYFLMMRICVGILAVIFIISLLTWTYRVYREFFRHRDPHC